jgi:hypothetical protein
VIDSHTVTDFVSSLQAKPKPVSATCIVLRASLLAVGADSPSAPFPCEEAFSATAIKQPRALLKTIR